MPPKTLSTMDPTEQQIKNRELAVANGGTLPAGQSPGLNPSQIETNNMLSGIFSSYDPQTIMDRYSAARKGVEASQRNLASRVEGDYTSAVEDATKLGKNEVASYTEAGRGFATNTAALRSLQETGEKRIRELMRQKNDLLSTNNIESANKISDLLLKENEAITNARTNFLNSYFGVKQEERASAGFETPAQTAVRTAIASLQTKAPDAGILPTDTYEQAAAKYRNSKSYKMDIAKGEADLALVKANTSKAYADAAANAPVNPPTGYNGEYAATISLASQSGGTNQQRTQISNILKTAIASGDYDTAYSQLANSTASMLKGTTATTFQSQANSLEVLDSLKTLIKQYADMGGKTNIFKGTADSIQTKIGALMTDPKYAAVATQLSMAFQNYRLQMTGAAFGAKESAEYASVMPSPGNTLDLNLAKLEGASGYLNSSVDGYLKTTLGPGAVEIKKKSQEAKTSPINSTSSNRNLSTGNGTNQFTVTLPGVSGPISFPSLESMTLFKKEAGIK